MIISRHGIEERGPYGIFHFLVIFHTVPMALLELDDELENDLVINCHALDILEDCHRFLTPQHNFKIATLNIRSIQRNFDSFSVCLKRLNIAYDVIVLTSVG